MARQPSVRVVNGHWASDAGGERRYFGKCSEVTRAEAMARLWAALANAKENRNFIKNSLDMDSKPLVKCRRRQAKSLKPLPLAKSETLSVDSEGERRGERSQEPLAFEPFAFSEERNAFRRKRTNEESLRQEPLASFESEDAGEESERTKKVRQGPSANRKLRSFENSQTQKRSEENQGRETLPSPLPSLSEQDAKTPSVNALRSLFLEWLQRHRSKRTHTERSRHTGHFAKGYGKRDAIAITGANLEAFLATIKSQDYRHKHEVSIKAMFRWGRKHGHLPRDFDPFATVEPTRPPLKVLLESDLATAEEVANILANATPRLADFLRVQYATGARTGELREACVGDFQVKAKQIVLRHHKREKTMREKTPRVIVLNDEAFAIVSRLAKGKESNAPLFMTPRGRRWTDKMLSHHFTKARDKAKIRELLTPYSLRHLWISEALMAGLDAFLVAKMAGTSVAMIERVYGRFRIQSLNDAQARLDAARQGHKSDL